MNTIDAIKSRRTIRKFTQEPVTDDELMTIIDAGRLAAFGANKQPLKFKILRNAAEIYPCTKWAGYLTDWEPAENERPTCYIAILGDTGIKKTFETEAGSAIANMMLAAVDLGLGTCWLGALDRKKLTEIIDTDMEVVYLLAVGRPAQNCKAVDIVGDDVKYFEDQNGTINVPKRTMSEVLV